jgi:hypothetical protein
VISSEVDAGGVVEAGEGPAVEEGAEVGVARQGAVDLDGHARGDGVRGRRREQVGQLGVAGRRLEHDRRAADATCLDVEDDPALRGQRMALDERLGSADAGLLGVGEHHDDVVAQGIPRGERADRLEHGGDP